MTNITTQETDYSVSFINEGENKIVYFNIIVDLSV